MRPVNKTLLTILKSTRIIQPQADRNSPWAQPYSKISMVTVRLTLTIWYLILIR
ncbi:hypothetical protein EVA_11860 [gut metagenome]|uniref:Uncharacterized protein n=1 Tax=gut metagenome TaxID=749906 RepID=J9FZQ6_9ZZZZ